MKRLGILILTLTLALGTMVFPAAASEQGNKLQIKAVIEQYYDLAYDSWWNLQMEEFSNVLDMTSVQSKNFVTALKENIGYEYSFVIKIITI